MERASDVLMREHRGIERMLRILEVAAARVERGQSVPAAVFTRAIEFIRGFADGCHHAKEERTLFPVLEARGIPQEGPIGVMLREHEEGRQYVRAMAAATDGYERGDPAARQALVENARGYTTLLRQHIMKEDSVLFPMSDRVLSEEDQRQLVERFEEIEREEVGEGVHERYHGTIEELERELGLAG
jgi:hemerythrin-like domain-containing protein